MWILMFAMALVGADEPKKTDKPLTPKQQREAAMKVITDKMAPIEKKLAESKEDLGYATNAKIKGSSEVLSGSPFGRTWYKAFKSEDKKKEVISKYEATIKDLEGKLKPLQDELKALKKTPLPKPETPPAKPEAKP